MSQPITRLSPGTPSAAPSFSGPTPEAMAGNAVKASKALAPNAQARDPRADKLRHAATEFESMMVKQLLKSAKLGGGAEDKSNGYGDMAVDALASSVERGGGLGLAHRIEEAIGNAHRITSGVGGGPQAAAVTSPAAVPCAPPTIRSVTSTHDVVGPSKAGR
jgi:Rod binding domain-containing protein